MRRRNHRGQQGSGARLATPLNSMWDAGRQNAACQSSRALVGRPLITALTTACEELSAAADDKHTQQHAGNSEQT
ncbi:unnamed protein product [Boreogadus saida]